MSIFQDKVAIVTGAASGIGEELAIELLKNGQLLLQQMSTPRCWKNLFAQ
jgi:NADP-dependent 3-hydroxy acid dehydrogenase YdfG